jgi:predicted nucleic acid-binding protein
MTDSPKYLYWDTSVILSYLKRTEGRWLTLHSLITEIEQSNRTRKIVTSQITHAETVYVEFDEGQGFSLEDESKLDNFWSDYNIIAFIEVNLEITRLARELKRYAKEQGWKLKLVDAIHLASAQWISQFSSNTIVFHTYDLGDFQKFSTRVPFPIGEPIVTQPPLFPH